MPQQHTDYSRISIGSKKVEDPTLELGNYKRANKQFGDKEYVLKAIRACDKPLMRDISQFYYRISGIYNRLCRYMAYMYKYDWMVTPYVNSDAVKDKEVIDGFHKTISYLENFSVKQFLGEAALKVIRDGCYYGYLVRVDNIHATVQELPPQYSRSRFSGPDGTPRIEGNMRFFDEKFPGTETKMKMLNVFPPEFKRGYMLYKSGQLPPQFEGDISGWYLLDNSSAFKFNLNGEDYPPFMPVIPKIIDLDVAQELDRKKMFQQLLKLIIQHFSLDDNGDPVLDVDEMRQLHLNAKEMIGDAIGVDVLTTLADVSVEDLSDNITTTSTDDLERVERTLYNEAGVSQMQFNTDGNIALEKSVLNDEASLSNLIQQFEKFLNKLLEPFNKSKKITYQVRVLGTTIYNYKELASLYKEQTSMGYSKMLPAIALGQSQSAVLADAYFENNILNLVSLFVPPLTSNTINADSIAELQDNKGGRPEKDDSEKSEKTIQNIESQG